MNNYTGPVGWSNLDSPFGGDIPAKEQCFPIKVSYIFTFIVNEVNNLFTVAEYLRKRAIPSAGGKHTNGVEDRRLSRPVFAGDKRDSTKTRYGQAVYTPETVNLQTG